MQSYSDFVDRVLIREDLLRNLQPSEPSDREALRRILAADDQLIAGGKAVGNTKMFALVRGGLLYAVDGIEQAHPIFQKAESDEGSYWHGMVHRREGDFDNARYWFRRAGTLACFAALHGAAARHSPTMARQPNWDAYLFTDECEQARFGAEELTPELAKLQRVEFNSLFDYCWRQSGLT